MRRGIVAAPQSEAAWEGRRVLDDGGNAADAAVTAALVQGVVDPHRCGIGGFGCATVHFPRETGTAAGPGGPQERGALAIDFHGLAGRRARPDLWAGDFETAAPDGFGYTVRGKANDVGHQSITVPGVVAGLAELHARFGTLPWRDLVLRAVPWAEEGFVVSQELAAFWARPGLHGRVSTRDRLAHTGDGRRICFHPDGTTYRTGELFRQPELGATYRRLAAEGPGDFYRGELARSMTEDWERHGALVTAEDLAGYRPRVAAPLRGSYRGLELLTTPLPGGGVALLQVLALLEPDDLGALGHLAPAFVDRVARVLQAVWADRLAHQGDPAAGAPEDASFLDPGYLSALRDRTERTPPAATGSPDTTQLSIVDRGGNVVSLAHSLGYNSGIFVPGRGVLLNNCMSAFDPRPGRRNSIAPGKARSTAVAETIVLERGRPRVVLGSPGAARITAALVEVLVAMADFGLSAAEAVLTPRFDAYGPGRLLLEPRFPRPVALDLAERGWEVEPAPRPYGSIGRVYAVEVRPDGEVVAGVDPGAPGAAWRQDDPPRSGAPGGSGGDAQRPLP